MNLSKSIFNTKPIKLETLLTTMMLLFLVVLFSVICLQYQSTYAVIGLIGSTILLTYSSFKLDILSKFK